MLTQDSPPVVWKKAGTNLNGNSSLFWGRGQPPDFTVRSYFSGVDIINYQYLWKKATYILFCQSLQLIPSSTHRIHGAAIYGNMDPINIPQLSPVMLAYIPAPWIRHGLYSSMIFLVSSGISQIQPCSWWPKYRCGGLPQLTTAFNTKMF